TRGPRSASPRPALACRAPGCRTVLAGPPAQRRLHRPARPRSRHYGRASSIPQTDDDDTRPVSRPSEDFGATSARAGVLPGRLADTAVVARRGLAVQLRAGGRV